MPVQPPMSPPPILFEDAEALVIDKPAGLPVTRPRAGGPSLDDHLPALALGYRTWPAPAHRIDQDTSGCLLLARNPRALKRLSAAFEDGIVAKSYLAILAGVPADREGTIDLPLAKTSSRAEGWRMRADPRGKPARTGWRLVAEADGRALILFTPETGRTHQLRVHAAEGLGLPILGDPVYGVSGMEGMMLHAWRIGVPRATKPAIAAEAPFPARFAALGFSPPES